MKINLNEKLWFSKHKGKRLKTVIDEGGNTYIKKLMDEYDIQFCDDAVKYLNSKNKKMSFNPYCNKIIVPYNDDDFL